MVEWRPRVLDGRPVMSVYLGADTTYSTHPEPTRVELWTTDDGRAWGPLDPDHPVAHVGGTETDIVDAPGGGWVAVTRMEGPHGWGSDICRADTPGTRNWQTRRYPNKLDSPLLFRDGDELLLIARRQVAFGGRYDLGWQNARTARPHSLLPTHLLGHTQTHRVVAHRSRIARTDLAARSAGTRRLLLPRHRAYGRRPLHRLRLQLGTRSAEPSLVLRPTRTDRRLRDRPRHRTSIVPAPRWQETLR